VITIDHLAKNTESRKYGATGSTAKLRAANGAVYEVVVVDEFSPAAGGKSALLLKKDRTGGVRALGHKRGDTVAIFDLAAPDAAGRQSFRLEPGLPPALVAAVAASVKLDADVLALDALTPAPSSRRDVMSRMGWGNTRADRALAEWRARQGGTSS